MKVTFITHWGRIAVCVGIMMPLMAASMPAQSGSSGASTHSFSDPTISPDLSEIAFVSAGDIWIAPADGGVGYLLVSNPATESRPIYSPDGTRLAFVSTRTGGGDIYVLTLDTGEVRRLTFADGNDQLDGWSRDGLWIYFSSTNQDISSRNDVFRISSGGGTPMPVTADRYTNEYFSAPSPDGSTLAFTARGIVSGQWWRNGHSHIDESEIWLMRDGPTPRYEAVTNGGAKDLWPMWNSAGDRLFFVSDRSGSENIWTQVPGEQGRQVTDFDDGRVLWPTISYDGSVIVFERDFAVWKLDTRSGRATPVSITRRGVAAVPGVEHRTYSDEFGELALSPDGKKVAFIVHGEVFAASAADGGTATRVTRTPQRERWVTWSPDSQSLAYVSSRNESLDMFTYSFSDDRETRLTSDAEDDYAPVFSPDGEMIAFQRSDRELRVLELASGEERLLASGTFRRYPSNRQYGWSPDSKWLAFAPIDDKSFRNIHVVSREGGRSRPVSSLANTYGSTLSWSPDGRFILFDTAQRTEPGQIARVDLVLRTPKFREDQFRELFDEVTPSDEPEDPDAEETTEEEKDEVDSDMPVEIVFDGIRERLSLLPVGVAAGYQAISPDGKWLLMIASAEGSQNLYLYSLDEMSTERRVARQLTSTGGSKSAAQFSPDSKEIFFLRQGRINTISVEGQNAKRLEVTAEMDVDFAEEKLEVFKEGWTLLRDGFFDPDFNGIDWEAIRDDYGARIRGAGSPDEMRRIMSLMVGELNASHLGVGRPPGANSPSVGRLGLTFGRREYEQSGNLKITEILPLGPAALQEEIQVGDYLLAVDGVGIGARSNLDQLLDHKINRRVELTLGADAAGADSRVVTIRPSNTNTVKGLRYRRWVEDNRAYVDRISNGRLGYVHMVNMSAGALNQLYVDLDAENHSREGVVIDIRENSGGFVNVYAIDVFSRRGYLTLAPRGQPATPARSILGQRALESPTILVTNQQSLSDAEDFTEGYRTLKLGKVVGEPTAGWIIYTGNRRLIDGSSFRVPGWRVTTNDGTVMEMNPRGVDIPVKRPIGESFTGRDSQLDTAVEELLKQIENAG